MLLFPLALDVLRIITHHNLSVCSLPLRQWKRVEWFVDCYCPTNRSNLAHQNTAIFKHSIFLSLFVLFAYGRLHVWPVLEGGWKNA